MTTRHQALECLRTLLLDVKPTGPDGFEGLVADCLASLTGLVFRLSKSGAQFGRDAASSPGAFAIAMEAKRYDESPTLEVLAGKAVLGGHELAGDIDVWVLGCTAAVGEGTVLKLSEILEGYGITLLTLDWTDLPLPPLAVLLAAAKPTAVDWFRQHVTEADIDQLSTSLDVIASDSSFDNQTTTLTSAMSASEVGLDSLRRRSADWLRERLVNRELSQLSFGQFVTVSETASPAQVRIECSAALLAAIQSAGTDGSVVAVVGGEGVGKTWLIAHWWATLSNPPIMLFVAGRRADRFVPSDPVGSLALLLAEQEGKSDDASLRRWQSRLDRWLRGGPQPTIRFVLVLDGLNERYNRPWADILKGLRPVLFALGGVVIASSRETSWKRDVVARLPAGFPVRTVRIGEYSDEELAEMLLRVHHTPADLTQGVREFVKNPRVCSVAMTLLDRLRLPPDELTVERLLLVYWQSRLEERGDLVAHNSADFNKLLQSHAKTWRDKPKRAFDRDHWVAHSGAAGRRGLREVQGDLSDIEEGRFLTTSEHDPSTYVFRKEALPFAIGLLINSELKAIIDESVPGAIDASEQLARILDPVRGFDAIGDIVTAAVGLACLDETYPSAGREALIRAWTGLQNVSPGAFQAIASHIASDPDAFLNVAEGSIADFRHVNRPDDLSEVLIAQRDHPAVATALNTRLPRWLGQWSRQTQRLFHEDGPSQIRVNEEREIRLGERLALLSENELQWFRQVTNETPEVTAIRLDWLSIRMIAARPLAGHATSIFGWALTQSVAHDSRDAGEHLAWILRLNSVDAAATSSAMELVLGRVDEHSSLPVRAAAARVLRMIGSKEFAGRADSLNPMAPGILLRRVAHYCETNPHDPAASVGLNIERSRAEVRTLAAEDLWSSMDWTTHDGNLRDATPALARFDPESLIAAIRQAVSTAPERAGVPLRQLAFHISDVSPLLDSTSLKAIREAQRRLAVDAAGLPSTEVAWASSELACGQIPHLPAEEQLQVILALPSGCPLFLHLLRGLLPLAGHLLDEQIELAAGNEEALMRILFFANGSHTPVTARSRRAVLAALDSHNKQLSIVAADLICGAGDLELDSAILERAATAPWALDESDESFYHGWAVAEAARRLRRRDAVSLIQPRCLSFVAESLGEDALRRLADITERALLRILTPVTSEAPAGVYPHTDIASEGRPRRSWVEEISAPSRELDEAALSDLVDTEGSSRRNADRHRQMVSAIQAYEKSLVFEGAAAIAAPPQVAGLKEVVAHDPARAGRWIDAIIATREEKLLSQARNLGLAVAGAYVACDAERAAAALKVLGEAPERWGIQINGLGLYEHALFTAPDVDALIPLRTALFANAFDDRALETATVTAEACGAVAWLSAFVDELLASPSAGVRARGFTIAGLRLPNDHSESVLAIDRGTGFLGGVAAFSRKNYERHAWARHWFNEAWTATKAVDSWRFARLAEGVADRRIVVQEMTQPPGAEWHRFGAAAFDRIRKAAEERSKKRAKTLFGVVAPERELVQLLRARS